LGRVLVLIKSKGTGMQNYIKKDCFDTMGMDEQVAGVSEKYEAAIKKIEWLECELDQKTSELNQVYKNQVIINNFAKDSSASLNTIHNKLLDVLDYLNSVNKHTSELWQENSALKSTGDQWLKRTLKLEFKILTTKDKLKTTENERDLAIKKCQRLQAELMMRDAQHF
jgi:hypothetical protein